MIPFQAKKTPAGLAGVFRFACRSDQADPAPRDGQTSRICAGPMFGRDGRIVAQPTGADPFHGVGEVAVPVFDDLTAGFEMKLHRVTCAPDTETLAGRRRIAGQMGGPGQAG